MMYLLSNLIELSVSLQFRVVCKGRCLVEVCIRVPMLEVWEQVYSSDYIRWVNKPEGRRTIRCHANVSHTLESRLAGCPGFVGFEESNPQEGDPPLGAIPNANVGVKDAEYATVSPGVVARLVWRMDHDGVLVRARVNNILISTEIIGSEVDSSCGVLVDSVVRKSQ
jgi:hypothetical protein